MRGLPHTVIVPVENWMDPFSLVRDNRRMMPCSRRRSLPRGAVPDDGESGARARLALRLLGQLDSSVAAL
jgi:hypothetical protein